MDRSKTGTKRSLLTDGHGMPIGLAVAGANRNDHKLVKPTLDTLAARRPSPRRKKQHLCLDKGYDYDAVRELVAGRGYVAHIPRRGQAPKPLGPRKRARRWVVERTHSWMNRFRRILIRWEKKAENYLAMLHLACAWIAFSQGGVLG